MAECIGCSRYLEERTQSEIPKVCIFCFEDEIMMKGIRKKKLISKVIKSNNAKNINFKQRRKKKMKNLFKKAKFEHKIDNELHSEFKLVYMVDVRNYVDGKLKTFLSPFIETEDGHYNGGRIYLTEEEVNFVIEEIEYFKKNKNWRT